MIFRSGCDNRNAQPGTALSNGHACPCEDLRHPAGLSCRVWLEQGAVAYERGSACLEAMLPINLHAGLYSSLASQAQDVEDRCMVTCLLP